MRWVRTSAVAAALLILSACSTPEERGPCPTTAIVSGADRLSRFLPGSEDLTDLVFEAEIEEVISSCTYGTASVDLDLTVVIAVRRGQALRDRTADFEYFVAVATPDQQVLARQSFPIALPFSTTERRLRLTELVQPTIPLTPEQGGQDFRIFIGFALTPEELRYNRENAVQ